MKRLSFRASLRDASRGGRLALRRFPQGLGPPATELASLRWTFPCRNLSPCSGARNTYKACSPGTTPSRPLKSERPPTSWRAWGPLGFPSVVTNPAPGRSEGECCPEVRDVLSGPGSFRLRNGPGGCQANLRGLASWVLGLEQGASAPQGRGGMGDGGLEAWGGGGGASAPTQEQAPILATGEPPTLVGGGGSRCGDRVLPH